MGETQRGTEGGVLPERESPPKHPLLVLLLPNVPLQLQCASSPVRFGDRVRSTSCVAKRVPSVRRKSPFPLIFFSSTSGHSYYTTHVSAWSFRAPSIKACMRCWLVTLQPPGASPLSPLRPVSSQDA